VVRLRHIDYVMELTRSRNKDIKFRRESRSVKAKKKKKKKKKTDYESKLERKSLADSQRNLSLIDSRKQVGRNQFYNN